MYDPNLSVSRIDPAAETREYAQAVLAKAAPHLDAQGMALLEEDLRSPCTEEIAAFGAFARTVAEGERAFVILDTALTGHTILLLDAAEAYHREVTRNLSDLPEPVRRLLPPARISPFAWVLNQSFAGDGFRDPLLVPRGLRELPFLGEVRERFARRMVVTAWKPWEPVGSERLRQLADAPGNTALLEPVGG